MGLSLVGIVLLGVSGWIGGEMVHVHGVGVAGFDAIDSVDDHRATGAEPSTTRLRHS